MDDKVVLPKPNRGRDIGEVRKPKRQKMTKKSKVLSILQNKAALFKYTEGNTKQDTRSKEPTLNGIKDCLNKCKNKHSKMERIRNCLNDCLNKQKGK